jgi:hypothetical protein
MTLSDIEMDRLFSEPVPSLGLPVDLDSEIKAKPVRAEFLGYVTPYGMPVEVTIHPKTGVATFKEKEVYCG